MRWEARLRRVRAQLRPAGDSSALSDAATAWLQSLDLEEPEMSGGLEGPRQDVYRVAEPERHRREYEELGYTVFPGVLTPQQVSPFPSPCCHPLESFNSPDSPAKAWCESLR